MFQLISGVMSHTMRGTNTGVYIGCGSSEAYEGFSTDPEHVKGYAPLGCTASMFANRISYAFDFKGKEWQHSVVYILFKKCSKYFKKWLTIT